MNLRFVIDGYSLKTHPPPHPSPHPPSPKKKFSYWFLGGEKVYKVSAKLRKPMFL